VGDETECSPKNSSKGLAKKKVDEIGGEVRGGLLSLEKKGSEESKDGYPSRTEKKGLRPVKKKI